MTIEAKSGALKAVSEGKAVVKLATLFAVDHDNDVIEENFFPTSPALKTSIIGFHRHDTPSLGHAYVRAVGDEVLASLEFNDSVAGQEMYKVLAWDMAHPPPVQEFSWAFRPKPGSARPGTFKGRQVRFLGLAEDGSHGIDLLECGPVLRGASVNSRLISVRSQDVALTRAEQDEVRRVFEAHEARLAEEDEAFQHHLRMTFLQCLSGS